MLRRGFIFPDAPGRRSSKRAAFTLVELLVVIGIIAILIAILLPVVNGAREASKKLVCSSNLQQWATAMHLYAQQEHGWLPRRGQGTQPVNSSAIARVDAWYNDLPPMLRMKSYSQLAATNAIPRVGASSIWICPSLIDSSGQYFFGYAMNMWLSTTQATMPDRINRIGSWSSMVFMTEAPGQYTAVLPWAAAAYNPIARHRGRINIAFVDGHVTDFTASEIGIGVGIPSRDDVRWQPPNSSWTGP